MRLLNVDTLELEWFPGNHKPPYAILSHTWGSEEIMLQDVASLRTGQGAGFTKTRAACAEASRRGFDYVWVDTCCIDKSSSAELSEAINSMFKWYENSEICFAYLDDVYTSFGDIRKSMSQSRWFTRGWTLQELLAPNELIFFSSDWSVIGTRHEYAGIVSDITGIEQKYLESQDTISVQARQVLISSATVAQKMDWASKRTTTRGEDMSYCLLGLFGINIPLLYGEGPERAFFRLQEAIVRDPTVFDVTLLAWDIATPKTMSPSWRDSDIQGLFARSINSFSGSQELALVKVDVDRSLTDRGLSIKLPVSSDSQPYLILPCHMKNDPWRLLALPIVRQGPMCDGRAATESGHRDSLRSIF
ncbi:heterokaryon incompatibility protein-domain-containing protein [Fusarium venenatum]|uniref:heterokaryon incompatibility protein-domain-containing protein n=1 Tax=Fusarium venenatum TaxID=56646 RepID=UPI001DF7C8F3|nr:heterokaryon incompatibility protein-domain-containing protein [Fusarium venenatum]